MIERMEDKRDGVFVQNRTKISQLDPYLTFFPIEMNVGEEKSTGIILLKPLSFCSSFQTEEIWRSQ